MRLPTFTPPRIPVRSGIALGLMLALVWSLLSSTAHQHQDEPLGVHGDCVYCLVQQQVSGAAFLALASFPVITASPAPEPVLVAVPAVSSLWVFHARAPPSRS